ncbi:Crp/Fnr family transcriptional regulator [Dyadobacter aurulentus]|uniref:Crp/Fnr family transcriptional regulator n=1 Tax=Dyadobacter sp. UC 10 TaxID=2605428 RepID=UPI0011F0B105|nr:Crp/Fnr family transcriptional regulator [Dyadobacter sp. UC 10]KAA0989094.1 Crp/Fnr family transcriptional regulator [Dyadobacter sp. UC 10]
MDQNMYDYGISPEEIGDFINSGKVNKVRAHKILFHQDMVCNSWVYIKSGIARQFIITPEGRSITKSFATSGQFMLYSATSFILQKQTETCFETLTDCEIIEFHVSELEYYLGRHRYKEYLNNILMELVLQKDDRESLFQKDAAATRVQQFTESHGDFFNRIPHYYIASYLGITPETLSRIRSMTNYGKQKLLHRIIPVGI